MFLRTSIQKTRIHFPSHQLHHEVLTERLEAEGHESLAGQRCVYGSCCPKPPITAMHSVAAYWEYAHIAAAGYNSIYVVEYDYTLSANAELQGSLEKKPVLSNLQENGKYCWTSQAENCTHLLHWVDVRLKLLYDLLSCSGAFVKQEQRSKPILVSEFKHRGRFCQGPRVWPPANFWYYMSKIL